MATTATQLRKDLFQTLDRTLQGETVEVAYKGETIVMKPTTGAKLSRLVRRNTIIVHPDQLAQSDRALMRELEQKWAAETL